MKAMNSVKANVWTTPTYSIGNAALWPAQLGLVVVFVIAGLMKLAFPIDQVAAAMGLPGLLIRFIGVAELAGATALDPLVSRAWPRVTALGAAGLAAVMLLASAYHLGRGEVAIIPSNLLLAVLAVFVSWRYSKRG